MDYRHLRETDLLLCMDMQQEQQVSRRGFTGDKSTERLTYCFEMLRDWRESNRPIVHLKRVAQAAWFNPASSLTNWIDGWTPLPGEDVFEHSLPSAYSSRRFSEFMDNLTNTTCHIIGFSLEEAVLATAIEAMHRGHDIRIVERAVLSLNTTFIEDASYRRVLLGVIQNFASIDSDKFVLGSTP